LFLVPPSSDNFERQLTNPLSNIVIGQCVTWPAVVMTAMLS